MSKFYYKGESIMNSFDLDIALESLDTAIDDIEIVEEGVGRDAAKFAKEERFRQLKQYSRDYKRHINLKIMMKHCRLHINQSTWPGS